MIERILGFSNTLRTRILLLFVVTISLVTLLTLVLTRDATYRHSTEQLEVHHLAASRVVADRLATRATLLRNGLRDISRSFSLKELVASGYDDPQSLAAAMENYRERLGADLFLVLGEDGSPIVGSLGEPSGLPNPMNFAVEGLTWHHVGGRHYLLKSAPLRFAERSPRVNAWLLMGQLSETLIDEQLVALTGMQVSLVELSDPQAVWGSTLEPRLSQELSSSLAGLGSGVADIQLGGADYVASAHALDEENDLYTVATLPLEEAYLNYQSLLARLAFLLLFALGVAFSAAMYISRGITSPLGKLVVAANQISEGQEATDFPDHSTREVNVLSRAIHDMQDGIRVRESEINRLAYHDELTGLPNRNSFVTRLNTELSELGGDEELMVALLDVDRFKEVNDTVGHVTGDRLLMLIADRLRGSMRDTDFIARLGGDEFAVVSRHRFRKPSRLGDELVAVFEQPFSIDGLLMDIDASAGLACAPVDSTDALGLLQKADIAMYGAKDSHEPYRVYHDSLNKHSVQRLSLMAELKEAIADGQLSLYYQPKLHLQSNGIQCVECLVRWVHPTYGFVSPDEFIGLAEHTGAIRQVTHWVLKTALTQQAAWREQGMDLSVAVNISAVDLVDMSLPAFVGELQSRFDLRPGDLTLEVTESAIMHDPESAILALRTLQRMGIVLSIDDFGTGFSSMAQLKKMPVQELKIDKAFVQALASNREDQVMVKTLISLAANLGLETVAEGVEDEASLAMLKEMGCDRAQGFHISRPLPPADFETWLSERLALRAV